MPTPDARAFLHTALCLLAAAAVAGCAKDESAPPNRAAAPGGQGRIERVDAALARAARFFVRRQSADGAWRSQTYGCFRDGPELTPHVLSCLFFLPQGGEAVRPAFDRGATYMMRLVGADGTVQAGPHGLSFPVFTAGSASRVVVLETRDEAHLRARDAWLALLRSLQLTEALGWAPTDACYGGWGFAVRPPHKPRRGEPRDRFVEANLVASIFGIAALRSARVPTTDPAYRDVLVFVKRCQNFPDDPETADPRFDDGGFFFIPDDPLQSKAGIAGTDRRGRTRFHSYGGMTADGLRALVRCGLASDHPRVAAARRWLERHFTASRNPGIFEADREVLRDATFYYYCWAVAHAFLAVRATHIEGPRGRVDWAAELADELVRRQKPDGSWTNRYTDAKEDDPLVATPWAAAALAIARGMSTGQHTSIGTPCGGSGPSGQ